MSVAIDLRLNPADDPTTTVKALTYLPAEPQYRELSETVYLTLAARRCDFSVQLTTDEARVLANQLLQVADVADAQRAARIEEDERQASFDEIAAEIHDAEDRGGRTGCLYAHPDVHYVPEDQLNAKVCELTAAGVKRFMVLAEPSFEGEAA